MVGLLVVSRVAPWADWWGFYSDNWLVVLMVAQSVEQWEARKDVSRVASWAD